MSDDPPDVECHPIAATTDPADLGVPSAPESVRSQARCAIGRASLPSDPYWQCPPIRISDCPTCGVEAGVQCAGIGRNDEVHVDRVWECLAGRSVP